MDLVQLAQVWVVVEMKHFIGPSKQNKTSTDFGPLLVALVFSAARACRRIDKYLSVRDVVSTSRCSYDENT